MEQKKRDRLVQFLNLATNEAAAPGECQNALGRATKIVVEHYDSWEAFVKRALVGSSSSSSSSGGCGSSSSSGGCGDPWWHRGPSWDDMRRQAEANQRRHEEQKRRQRTATGTEAAFLSACRFPMPFGKRRHDRLGDIALDEWDYLEWLYNNLDPGYVHEKVETVYDFWDEYEEAWERFKGVKRKKAKPEEVPDDEPI